MSGHSKWSTIKRHKQAQDAKRGLLFSKLAMAIAIAVREGGGVSDPAANFRLRLAIEKARAASMPKENIDRAIERGKGKEASGLQEVLLEGFGPGGAAIVVETATNNHLRTLQKVKSVFDLGGGRMGSKGSVAFLFERTGLATVESSVASRDKIVDAAVAAGAKDLEEEREVIDVYCEPEMLHELKEKMTAASLNVRDVQIIYRPLTFVPVDDHEKAKKLVAMLTALEDCEDVQKVYTNADIADQALST